MPIQEIPIEKLKPPKRDSRFMRNEYFESFLSQDIAKESMIIPILVRPLKDGFFEIVDGTTRYFGLRRKGVKKATCNVKQLSDEDALVIRVKLNMNRKKTDYVGIASDLQELKEKGFSVKELCERFGWKKAWIYRLLSLNKLSFEEKIDIAEGRTTVTRAYERIMQKRIPKHEKERKIVCSCCRRKEAQAAISYLKLCRRCAGVLERAHQEELKHEKIRQRHKRLVY